MLFVGRSLYFYNVVLYKVLIIDYFIAAFLLYNDVSQLDFYDRLYGVGIFTAAFYDVFDITALFFLN